MLTDSHYSSFRGLRIVEDNWKMIAVIDCIIFTGVLSNILSIVREVFIKRIEFLYASRPGE